MGIKDQFQDKAQELKEKAQKGQKQPGKGPQDKKSQRTPQPKDSPQRSFDDIRDELDDRT
ncbi:hypothetical protein [Streptomyces nojiriensis]|uniref:Antitoxin n=1 Tax=Streptomyces nojiriensis TaxID=66374 RepID=A0ABQ3SWC3_9ACTN|nr:hypothetical protein [Streptomyces nojiriensis]QTI45923.1 hypothetical protein JYK04_03732 [Streptomyces nojiriensis]GGR89481.1 hypothetical protein GCM10010205_17430 [Streptomyces nojiriensis]GHI72397.1 hypothetical protein Snoj_63150 [Streptomyces nojiriensis]